LVTCHLSGLCSTPSVRFSTIPISVVKHGVRHESSKIVTGDQTDEV